MTNLTQEIKGLAQVGGDIGLAKGMELVQNFRETNPTATPGHYIGRDIIDQILSQPGCVGITFRKCLSENNEEHLVYTAVDADGKDILQYSVVTNTGDIVKQNGIVADLTIINWDLFQ